MQPQEYEYEHESEESGLELLVLNNDERIRLLESKVKKNKMRNLMQKAEAKSLYAKLAILESLI
jgi:hypothetical protein